MIATALIGGCQSGSQPGNNVAAAAAPAKAPPNPLDLARAAVVKQLGTPAVAFAEAQLFSGSGEQIVCGRYQAQGQAPLRYISVDGEFVFLEGHYVGDFGQAFAETCRNP